MKKLVSLAIALVMATGLSLNAYAASGNVVGFASNKSLASGYASGKDSISGDTVDLGNVYANDAAEREIYLYENMFVDSSGNLIGDTTKVLSSSEIKNSRIAVRSTVRGNSKVLKETPSLNSSKGRIDVKFASSWTSTKSEDFEITIYLTIDGKRYEDYSVVLTGTFGNEEDSVYADQDYVDISDGRALYAEESVNKIEIDIGEGVSIFTKLVKGKTYYGQATRDVGSSDEEIIDKHSDIVDVYNISVVGLSGSGNIVKIETDYSGYVYDSDLKYLGTTSEMMPLLTKYYISTKKLDVKDDNEPEDPEPSESESESEPEESSEPTETSGGGTGGTGGGSGGDYSIGQNPDTGSRSFVGLAVMAAMLSLVAGVAVFRRK